MSTFMNNWLLRRAMSAPRGPKEYIQFADPAVEAICVANWSSDGVGLTYEDAAAVTSQQFGTTFQGNTQIVSFDEFQYFTGVTSVPDQAFMGCSALSAIQFPQVVQLGNEAFKNCPALQIEVQAPLLQAVGYNLFQNSGIAKVLDIGSVTDLGYYCFADTCRNLTEVRLPSTLTSIENFSFWGNTQLQIFVLLATNPPSLGGSVFTNTPTSMKIYVPYSADHSILDAYKAASGWSDYASQIFELNPDGTIPS